MALQTLLRILLASLLLVITASAAANNSDRQRYRQAHEALRLGDFARYQQLRQQLEHYPLAIYLDYYRLFESGKLASVSEAQAFIARAEKTPLARRARGKMLERLARNEAWRDYLLIAGKEPVSEGLRCYYYRAKLATGERQQAWQGAEKLWLSAKPVDSACDPLFDAWASQGGRSQDQIWARLLLADDAKESGLARNLSRKLTGKHASDAALLLKLSAQPQGLAAANLNSSPRHRQLVDQLLPRWAAKDAAAAQRWYRQQGMLLLGKNHDHRQVQTALVRAIIRQQQEALYPWADKTLASLRDAGLIEERSRQALRQADHQLLATTLGHLQPEDAKSARWQYWLGVVTKRNGQQQASRNHFTAAASERDFYGFLAADAIGQKYRLNHNNSPLPGSSLLQRDGGTRRAEELLALGEEQLARSEWQNMLSRLTSSELEALAEWSLRQDWPQLAIAAASKAEAWDRLNLRFPLLYQETFQRYAKQHGLKANELLAIARRESALNPGAKSSVGARGLMQLMPATAKQVAKANGLGRISVERLHEVNTNVALGSAYYRELLEDFGHNRIFAIASYNAGPGRIRKWREGKLDAAAWVEAIPFKETRQYVQAVMTYNVIYARLQQQQISLLTPQERDARY